MMLVANEQHRNLCDEIILQQKALIDDHELLYPKELEEMYALYLQEVAGRAALQDSVASNLPALPPTKV